VLSFAAAQVAGAVAGVWVAHVMFAQPILQASQHIRTGPDQWAGEFVATFGLISIIEIGRSQRSASMPAIVALYIVAAYWFTSSTSFANPAVTMARALTDTFAGIAPASVLGFLVAQTAGALAAAAACRLLQDTQRQSGAPPERVRPAVPPD
jgi:glycerol uptake facilitator-like aquaporin